MPTSCTFRWFIWSLGYFYSSLWSWAMGNCHVASLPTSHSVPNPRWQICVPCTLFHTLWLCPFPAFAAALSFTRSPPLKASCAKTPTNPLVFLTVRPVGSIRPVQPVLPRSYQLSSGYHSIHRLHSSLPPLFYMLLLPFEWVWSTWSAPASCSYLLLKKLPVPLSLPLFFILKLSYLQN